MTKLMEWLFGLTVICGIWLSLVTNRIESGFVRDWPNLILFMPVLLVLIFGVSFFVAVVIGYVSYAFDFSCQNT